jgi:hypothetical protein
VTLFEGKTACAAVSSLNVALGPKIPQMRCRPSAINTGAQSPSTAPSSHDVDIKNNNIFTMLFWTIKFDPIRPISLIFTKFFGHRCGFHNHEFQSSRWMAKLMQLRHPESGWESGKSIFQQLQGGAFARFN